MSKHRFEAEFPFKTSPKILFNYLNTPGGLQQWFADNVSLDSDRNFLINWDGELHKATRTSRAGKSVRYDFLEEHEGNSLEFKLITGELDGSTYLKVIDTSDNEDNEDLMDLWDGLINDLKDIVGG